MPYDVNYVAAVEGIYTTGEQNTQNASLEGLGAGILWGFRSKFPVGGLGDEVPRSCNLLCAYAILNILNAPAELLL